ncbi:phosphatidylinositol phosphate synthase [Luteococcus sp. Sow4_B9]|uniref:phosphatidylinositol phosphate synthase n=1 Tax=Luteococcus sp. Sow4_B9 TaxID=3438792 RepID=UPI003F9ADE56
MVERFRQLYAALMTPAAKLAIALRMTPDMVTWFGTLLVVVLSLWLVPAGLLWQGALAITVCVLTDGVDGQMARMTGRGSSYGAFLDSTLDRVADGAIFGSVALWYAGGGDSVLWSGAAIAALVMGQVTSYAKARGLALGFKVWGGLAARGDRLVVLLVGMLLAGLELDWALPVALCYLVAASTWTVLQRMGQVKQQAREAEAAGRTVVDPQATVAAEHTAEQRLHRKGR